MADDDTTFPGKANARRAVEDAQNADYDTSAQPAPPAMPTRPPGTSTVVGFVAWGYGPVPGGVAPAGWVPGGAAPAGWVPGGAAPAGWVPGGAARRGLGPRRSGPRRLGPRRSGPRGVGAGRLGARRLGPGRLGPGLAAARRRRRKGARRGLIEPRLDGGEPALEPRHRLLAAGGPREIHERLRAPAVARAGAPRQHRGVVAGSVRGPPAAPVARERSSASANASSAASQSSTTVASRPRCRPRLPTGPAAVEHGLAGREGRQQRPQPRGGLRVLEHRARLGEHHADAEAVQARQRRRRPPGPRAPPARARRARRGRRPPRPSPPTRAGQEGARRASPARPRPPRRACRAAAPPSAAAPHASR